MALPRDHFAARGVGATPATSGRSLRPPCRFATRTTSDEYAAGGGAASSAALRLLHTGIDRPIQGWCWHILLCHAGACMIDGVARDGSATRAAADVPAHNSCAALWRQSTARKETVVEGKLLYLCPAHRAHLREVERWVRRIESPDIADMDYFTSTRRRSWAATIDSVGNGGDEGGWGRR